MTIPTVRGRSGKGFLAGFVKQALGRELGLQSIEGDLQGADPPGFNGVGIEGVLASEFIDPQVSSDQNQVSILEWMAKLAGFAAEAHAFQLGSSIFQCEVDVPGGGDGPVGDLPLDQHPLKFPLQE